MPIVCAFLVCSGSQLDRYVGITASAIGCISAIWWMPYYPIRSLTYIASGFLVIYALAAGGGRAETWQQLRHPTANVSGRGMNITPERVRTRAEDANRIW